jgi:L-asparagine transporter-like permease
VEVENESGLHRGLRGRQLTMIGLGGAIGTGLFLGSSLAISQAGPATIIAYIACAAVALVIGWALAASLSAASESSAYLALFGVSVFGALVVWLLILATHWAFRRTRKLQGLPPSPVQLRGAPVTSLLAMLFLAGALISTWFIAPLRPAWWAGVPFFAILSVAYWMTSRRSKPLTPAKKPI